MTIITDLGFDSQSVTPQKVDFDKLASSESPEEPSSNSRKHLCSVSSSQLNAPKLCPTPREKLSSQRSAQAIFLKG